MTDTDNRLNDAALALATMQGLLATYERDALDKALITVIMASRTGDAKYGIVRLETVRDDIAELAAKLANEVIKLDTAIKSIQNGE